MLEKGGIPATVVSLGSFQTIYKALAAGEIDAGYLPVDLRFLGENEHGFNAIAALPVGAGGIATTRRLIASDRELVSRFVQASVDTIALFKTRPDIVVPLLQRYLAIDDRKSVEQLLAYYASHGNIRRRTTSSRKIWSMPRLSMSWIGRAISSGSIPTRSEFCGTADPDFQTAKPTHTSAHPAAEIAPGLCEDASALRSTEGVGNAGCR